jgi:glycosyltransferase involved in cell wall biosynthesis
MSPVPIIYVIGSLNVGGAERHLAQVLPRLNRKHWAPTVYCITERGELAEDLQRVGIPVICSTARPPQPANSRARRLVRIAAATLKLTSTMRTLRPAIAHFFLPGAYLLGAPASLMARIPIRIMSRRSLSNYQQNVPLSAMIERRLHPWMTAVLGNSLSVVRQLRDNEGVALDRLGLIYNGLDNDPFRIPLRRNDVRASLGIRPDALTFVIVANLIPYKGHRDLIAAFGKAHPRLPAGWRLLVVGRDDGIGAKLRDQAASLGIAENVIFLGSRRDVPDILRSADIGVSASHQEGFSNAILESMAAALPTIATNVGGNPEAIVDGETGLIVAPRDLAQMQEAIERLASDTGLRAMMGQEASRRIEQHFGLDTCVARYEELYEGLMKGKRPGEIDSLRFPA